MTAVLEELVKASELRARIYELERKVNQLQVERYVREVIIECGVTEPHVSAIAEQFAGATCGLQGTYQTPTILEAAVRASVQRHIDASVQPSNHTP